MAWPERIVLISRDAGLRSGLAARLGLSGFILLTIDGDDPAGFEAHALAAQIVILDAADGTGPHLQWLRGLCNRGLSARVIVIGSDQQELPAGAVRIARGGAGQAVADQLRAWG